MTIEFLHIADVHLGYQQYSSAERFNDFGRAYFAAVDYAIDKQVDFIVISGDLFHKSAIDAPTLLQAVHGLEKLKQAGIRVAAIAGNHDEASYRDAGISWLDYLEEREYLYLLRRAPLENDQLVLSQADGHYVDFGSVRVAGIPYMGSGLPHLLPKLPSALASVQKPEIGFTILLLHAGVEREMPRMSGGLTHNELAPLRSQVDYLALGHLHKPFEREEWIYNPGSLEVCSMGESRWPGGFYHVVVDPNTNPKHRVTHIKSKRRPFYRLNFPVDAYLTPTALLQGLHSELLAKQPKWTNPERPPVVEVRLEGVLQFERSQLDIVAFEQAARDIIQPLLVRVRNHSRPVAFEITPEEGLGRAELEKAVFRELVLRDGRFQAQADTWSELMGEVKTAALTKSTPESIVDSIRHTLNTIAEEPAHVD